MTPVNPTEEYMVERYLAGQLSQAEVERFEAYWRQHPELTRSLESCARLKNGLADLRDRGELKRLVQPTWWPSGMRLMALAASISVVAVGATAWHSVRARSQVALAAVATTLPAFAERSLPMGEVVSIMRLRSASFVDANVVLPAQPRALLLRVLPEWDASASYKVNLTSKGVDGEAGRELAVLTDLQSGSDGFLNVYVDSRTLRPGRYRLNVVAMGSADVAESSHFEIEVRAPAPIL